MDANAEKVAAAFEDDATADLFEGAPPPFDGDAPEPPATYAPVSSTSRSRASDTTVSREPAPGLVLRERYVLEQRLAAGGTAIVYRARDLRREDTPGGGLIALKFLRPERRARPHAVESLRREFQCAQTLSHPNIARVFDLDCDAGLWFLTLELLEGETLGALLKRPGEPMAPRRALEILRGCGEALAYAHERGVVHGDFKPGNIFITRHGQVRVLDFGAAAASSRSGETRVPAATPPYASPQVLIGDRPERRDDVFSFACVAYELLNGRHPFGHRSSLEARVANLEIARAWNLSPRQWHALEQALAWEREQRPSTLRALLADLSSSDVPPPIEIPAITAEARTFRAPTLAPIATLLALVILGASALGLAYSRLNDRGDAARQQAIDALRSKAAPAQEPPRNEAPVSSGPAAPATPAPVAKDSASPPPVAKKSSPSSTREPSASATASAPASARVATATVPAATVRRTTGAVVTIDTPSVDVSEGAVSAVLRLTRSQQLAGRLQLRWHTLSGSAVPGNDFLPVLSGTADFADGQITRAIYIPLVNDRLVERDETFKVELTPTDSSARIFPTATAQITIRDDDRAAIHDD